MNLIKLMQEFFLIMTKTKTGLQTAIFLSWLHLTVKITIEDWEFRNFSIDKDKKHLLIFKKTIEQFLNKCKLNLLYKK